MKEGMVHDLTDFEMGAVVGQDMKQVKKQNYYIPAT